MNSSRDVESLVADISDLPESPGPTRDALTIVERRLHLAKTTDGHIEVFVEGTRESFGRAAIGHSMEFGNFRETKDSREFSALLIRCRGTDIRPMAHVVYEAYRHLTLEPDISNERLLELLSPYLGLILERRLFSIEQQMGLLGELLFLTELLNRAAELHADPGLAIQSWTGWDSASRDFASSRVAVEAKVTRRPTRDHLVHPMYQLLAADGSSEKVYVYSVGVSIDLSRPFRLLTAVDRVLEYLSGSTRQLFLSRLSEYGGLGFKESDRRRYELEPGFLITQPPVLIRVDNLTDILRPESFAGDTVPARVHDLTYVADLNGLSPVSKSERESILDSLLTVTE